MLLRGEMVWLGRNALPDLLVQVSWSAFRALCRGAPPDFRKLAAVGAAAKCGSFRGVIVTCALPATYREAGALATRLGASTSLDGGRAAERAADRALLEQLAAAEASLAGAYGYEPIDFVSRCFYPSVGVDEARWARRSSPSSLTSRTRPRWLSSGALPAAAAARASIRERAALPMQLAALSEMWTAPRTRGPGR